MKPPAWEDGEIIVIVVMTITLVTITTTATACWNCTRAGISATSTAVALGVPAGGGCPPGAAPSPQHPLHAVSPPCIAASHPNPFPSHSKTRTFSFFPFPLLFISLLVMIYNQSQQPDRPKR